MDTRSALLIIKMIAEGIGVAKEVRDLAKRVEAGDIITDEELQQARTSVSQAVGGWDSTNSTKQ